MARFQRHFPAEITDAFRFFGKTGHKPPFPVDGEEVFTHAVADKRPAVRSLCRVETARDVGGADTQWLGGESAGAHTRDQGRKPGRGQT